MLASATSGLPGCNIRGMRYMKVGRFINFYCCEFSAVVCGGSGTHHTRSQPSYANAVHYICNGCRETCGSTCAKFGSKVTVDVGQYRTVCCHFAVDARTKPDHAGSRLTSSKDVASLSVRLKPAQSSHRSVGLLFMSLIAIART